MDDFEALGAAEKHVACQLRAAIQDAYTKARALADALEEIDTDYIEQILLDSDRKESAIALVDPLQTLGSNLGASSLMPLLVKIMLTPKDALAS